MPRSHPWGWGEGFGWGLGTTTWQRYYVTVMRRNGCLQVSPCHPHSQAFLSSSFWSLAVCKNTASHQKMDSEKGLGTRLPLCQKLSWRFRYVVKVGSQASIDPYDAALAWLATQPTKVIVSMQAYAWTISATMRTHSEPCASLLANL